MRISDWSSDVCSSDLAAIQEQRRFSRQNEQEADRIGLQNLEKAGYDPRSMPSMFERRMRQYRFDARPPEFLLHHPVTESRIADTRNRAEQARPGGIEDSRAGEQTPELPALMLHPYARHC